MTKIRKKTAYIGLLALVAFYPVIAQAQEDEPVSLDSYLGEIVGDETPPPSPGNESLPAIEEEAVAAEEEETALPAAEESDGSLFDKALGEIMETMPNLTKQEEEPRDDALPAISDVQFRLETQGFDGVAARDINTRIDVGDLEGQTPEELEAEIRREAFDAAITGMFPLQPDNIRSLLGAYEDTQKAIEEPLKGVPTPQINVQTISLDPGVEPMVISTSTGYITTLNMLDITGAPWPIQDISWAGNFEVTEPEEGGHIVRIMPLGNSAYGNISMRLLTLKTPVTIRLETVDDRVQYRIDARIPEYGPFAEAQLIQGGIERVAGNGTIMSILDGVIPDRAEKLAVSGVDGRTTAYRLNNMTYVRSPLTLLSPGWEQSVSSADGMNVYVLADAPVLLFSDSGSFERASLSPYRNFFDE
ncbi:MAG: DotH/IcmK family type IV secretion protein [Pseudomonadota bacterium]